MQTRRLYYIDWLRVLVILALIPYHAALTYLKNGFVYIKEPVSDLSALPFLIITVPLYDFFMTLLFFVSGIASFYSFQKRDSKRYMGERLKKLMFPFLMGFLFLCPLTGYIQALYEGRGDGFLDFLPQFFWFNVVKYKSYAHLWFLLYLLVFSILCAPIFNLWKDRKRIDRIATFISRGYRLLIPVAVVILLEVSLRPHFHAHQTLVFDWANDAVYLAVFICGYIYAADLRIQKKVTEYYKISIVFGLLSLTALFYVNVETQMQLSDNIYLSYLWVLARGVYECSAIIFLLNIGKKMTYLNEDGKAIRYLSRASFTYYIFHYLPVTFFTFLFIGLKIPIFLKFLMVIVLSYVTVFIIYEILRRLTKHRFTKQSGSKMKRR